MSEQNERLLHIKYATGDSYSTNILTCDLVGNEGIRGHTDTLYSDVRNVEEQYIRTKAR